MKSVSFFLPLIVTITLALGACEKKEGPETKSSVPPVTLITTAAAQTRSLEIREETVGTLEGLIDPVIAAEVAARVMKVLVHAGDAVKEGQLLAELDGADISLQRREAQAEISRLQVLLENQGKVVERNRQLVQKNFISQNALDDVTTQQSALREQIEGARAHLASIEHNATKTRVYAPLDGRVEKQVVSVGDYVKIGDPLFQVIGIQKLRAHLPFPENIASKLHAGQTVRLVTPTMPGEQVNTTIKEIKPLIGSGNRAADIIADLTGKAGWYPGASVNGAVVLGEHAEAVVVPEASVVLRPAGEVVYVVQGNKALQRIVKTGLRQNGLVEITEGLAAGETIAVDGAGYLTDKAAVKVQQASGSA